MPEVLLDELDHHHEKEPKRPSLLGYYFLYEVDLIMTGPGLYPKILRNKQLLRNVNMLCNRNTTKWKRLRYENNYDMISIT